MIRLFDGRQKSMPNESKVSENECEGNARKCQRSDMREKKLKFSMFARATLSLCNFYFPFLSLRSERLSSIVNACFLFENQTKQFFHCDIFTLLAHGEIIANNKNNGIWNFPQHSERQ